jgi:acyl-CoA dehydrogenase
MSDHDMRDMLLDQAERLFTDLIDRDLMSAAEAGKHPAALAHAIEEFGLADALVVAAEDGGLSFGDAASVFAQLGKHVVPLPIAETLLSRAILARAGLNAVDGAIGLAADMHSPLAFGDQLAFAVAKQDDMLLLLPLRDAAAAPHGSISRHPRVSFDLSAITPAATAPWPGLPTPELLGAMLRASQIAGAIERTLTLSIEYANTRKQFGRPIGRFQAVQQLLAKLAAEAAAARSACDVAWAALDEGGDVVTAGMIAKIRASEAARVAAAIAHQVHGAIGVTDEHFLHYVTRRLWEWRQDYGSDVYWSRRLGALARANNGDLWAFITAHSGIAASAEASQ